MGYFPNGDAGDYYEAHYCTRCVHRDDKPTCVVWELHLFHNYEECNNPNSFLHVLIPRNKDGSNGQCRMFKPAEIMARRPVRQREKSAGELI